MTTAWSLVSSCSWRVFLITGTSGNLQMNIQGIFPQPRTLHKHLPQPGVQMKVSHFKRQVGSHLMLSPECHPLYFINSLRGRGCPLISCLSRQPDSKSASGLMVPDGGNQCDRNMWSEMIQQVPLLVPTPTCLCLILTLFVSDWNV